MLTYREREPNESLEPLVRLRERVLGRPDPGFQSRLDWLLANPHGDNIWVLCLDGDQTVGMMNMMPQPISGRGTRFMSMLAMLALVDPANQRQGIYSHITQLSLDMAAARHIPVCLGYTMLDYVLRAELKAGWLALGTAPVLVCPTSPGAIVSKLGAVGRLAAPIAALVGRPYVALLKRRFSRQLAKSPFTFSTPTSFSDDYDAIADHNVNGPLFDVHKDARHLNWKYLGDPNTRGTHLIVEARRAGDLAGAVVLSFGEINRFSGAMVLDMIARHETKDAIGDALAWAMLEHVLPRHPDLVACLASPSMPEYAMISRLGFLNARRGLTLIFKKTDSALPAAAEAWTNWVNVMGNNDNV